MLFPPPPSTLFPYTTLFRSFHLALKPFTFQKNTLETSGGTPLLISLTLISGGKTTCNVRSKPRNFPPTVVVRWRRDRKSTRLNSSHRCISYAVFCLKKKNIQ